MPSGRKHHKDPPATAPPRDWAPPAHTRRTLKRAATAFVAAGLTGFTYALLPMAFAVGGAAVGLWYIGAKFYEWLDAGRDDDEPLRS